MSEIKSKSQMNQSKSIRKLTNQTHEGVVKNSYMCNQSLKTPEQVNFEEDLNLQLAKDEQKFLGNFLMNRYQLSRKYIISEYDSQIKLYYNQCKPLDTPIKAQICFVHGLVEHSGNYMDMAQYFAQNGYIFHMIDMSSFGYSGGTKLEASIEKMQTDLITMMKESHSDIPLYLLGFSTGGSLVLNMLQKNSQIKVAGVISISTNLYSGKKLNFFQQKIFQIMEFLFQSPMVKLQVNHTAASKNNYNIQKLVQDSVAREFIGVKLRSSIDQMQNELQNTSKQNLNVPLLMICGSNDWMTSFQDAQNFFCDIPSKDKNLSIFKEGYHDLIHDNEKKDLKKLIIQWLDKRYMKAAKIGSINKLKLKTHSNLFQYIKNIILLYLIQFKFGFQSLIAYLFSRWVFKNSVKN